MLWWLLRVTPPAPRRVRFPALRLLLGLVPREETPAKTPLWLILLRMVLAALIILALAHPLLNPNARLAGTGPLVLVVDNGWASARNWDERKTVLGRFIDQAERETRRIVLLDTAPPAGSAAPKDLSLLRPADARAASDALAPEPWPNDRRGALARLQKFDLGPAPDIVWLSDGIDDGAAADFAASLAERGPLTVFADAPASLPRLLAPGDPDDKDLTAQVERADHEPSGRGRRARGRRGRAAPRPHACHDRGGRGARARAPADAERAQEPRDRRSRSRARPRPARRCCSTSAGAAARSASSARARDRARSRFCPAPTISTRRSRPSARCAPATSPRC